jgi:hypothetical protein
MILPKVRDPRFITIRRGGVLTDSDHHLLALWAANCAEHVIHLYDRTNPVDARPKLAIEMIRAWVAGEVKMKQAHNAALALNSVARGLPDSARFAVLSAGQALGVAHVAAHELGAAAYAIRAVMNSVDVLDMENARREECQWQREQLPREIRNLVLDDQRLRNELCWFVFS